MRYPYPVNTGGPSFNGIEEALTSRAKLIPSKLLSSLLTRLDYLLEYNKEDVVTPFLKYMQLGGTLIEKPKDGNVCGCMDERCICNTKLAGSGIFHIYNLIKEGKNRNTIIETLKATAKAGNITTITSHEDCGAAKLFCNSFSRENTCEINEIISLLGNLFPGIDDSFSCEPTADNIVAHIIKYFAGEVGVKYEHLKLSKDNSGEILPHFSRSMFVNLTLYDIPNSLKNAGLEQGFCCDLGKFLDEPHFEDYINGIIGQICNEIIVGKHIANNNVGISKDKKMQICFIVNKENEVHKKKVGFIQRLVGKFINSKHPEFIGKYNFNLIET